MHPKMILPALTFFDRFDTIEKNGGVIKMMKRLFLIAMVAAICFSLCACGISRDEAVGTWSGTYEYNGNQFAVAFVLKGDGDYSKVVYKNGSLSSAEEGTWEVQGGKVILHENGNMGSSTKYTYKGGALVNNDHKFYKK